MSDNRKKEKGKVYAVDPVTGLKRINYCPTVNLRYRWDKNVPGGILIELPDGPTDYEVGNSNN